MKKVFTLFFATVVLMLYAGAANTANGQTRQLALIKKFSLFSTSYAFGHQTRCSKRNK